MATPTRHSRFLSSAFLALSGLMACTGQVGITSTGPETSGAGGSGGSGGSGSTSGSTGTGGASGSQPRGTAGTDTGGAGSGGANVGTPPTAIPTPSSCTGGQAPGPRALRRLSAAELTATLKDLFGDPAIPLTNIFDDPQVLGFTNDAHSLVVQGLGAQQLMDQAEAVAHWAATTHMSALSSCTSQDANCRQSFIKQFGKKVHRAPLTDADVATYEALFTAEASFTDGVEAVTSAMLQSPYFLYRRELGSANGGNYDLSPYEIASGLSYFLTGSMPDTQLLAAADNGSLSTEAGRDRETERLLQSTRGHDSVMNFMSGWFGLQKLTAVAKDDNVFKLTPSLRSAMAGESRSFVDNIVYSQRGTLTDLLTSNRTFVNAELAAHYGLPNAAGMGTQMTGVTLASNQRDFGLLAQGSIMTAYATAAEPSAVQRGKLVRVRLLCEEIAPPPPNLDTMLKAPAATSTSREHFAEHSKNSVCRTCHTLMDPIGFGFEHYDAFGRRRENDGGKPVDASGTVMSGIGGDVPFDGVAGLTKYLTTTAKDQVTSCMIRYWSYFAFGAASWDQDQCTYEAVAGEAAKDSNILQSVAKAITHTARFTHRTVDP